MPELSANLLLMMGLSVLVAGVTNGMSGMGFAILMATALALVVDPKTAVVLLSITVPAMGSQQLVRNRREARHAHRVVPLLVSGLLGVALGVVILTRLPTQGVGMLLGVFTVLFVLSSFRKVRLQLRPAQERIVAPLVGLAAGVCNGTIGVSSPILAAYLLALDLTPATFAFSISVLFIALSLVRLVGLIILGQVTPALVLIGLGLLLPGTLGQQVGFWLQSRISRESFQRVILALLLVSGLGLIRRGVGAQRSARLVALVPRAQPGP